MKRLQDIDFSVTPFVAIWEITQACDLACRHCRAEAISHRDPGELMTREGFDLMDKIHSMKEWEKYLEGEVCSSNKIGVGTS